MRGRRGCETHKRERENRKDDGCDCCAVEGRGLKTREGEQETVYSERERESKRGYVKYSEVWREKGREREREREREVEGK